MHPSKWIIYISIFAFTIIAISALTTALQSEALFRQSVIDKAVNQARNNKATADSLAEKASSNITDVLQQKTNDSLYYKRVTQILKNTYQQKQQKHETGMVAIDSLTDNEIIRSFSVHRMLSDSAVTLWR